MMKLNMPIGIDDFKEAREKYYLVDKTDFIRRLIDDHSKVTLITRPRRFGKTLTMSMLDYFSGRVEARFNDINTVMGQKRAVKLFTDIRDRMLKELPDTLAQATVDDMREMLTEFVNLNGMRHGLDLTDPEESEEPAEQTQPAEQAQS